jgi:hypothetical protein
MYDPNESFQILSIMHLDRTFDPSVMNVMHFTETLNKCGNWIHSYESDNKTGVSCVPSITMMFMFDNDESKSLYSFVITQPKSYFEKKDVTSLDFKFLANNIHVLLSMLAEDNDDEGLYDIFEWFENSAHEFMGNESYVHYIINDGILEPAYIQMPYWMTKEEAEASSGS